MLTTAINLVGKPPQLYQAVLDLLDDTYRNRITPENLLAEIIRLLLLDRNEKQQRINALVTALKTTDEALSLSTEDIINLIEKHLSLKGTSRLPVLMVSCAYDSAKELLGETAIGLQAHNAADLQTGALGMWKLPY